MSKIEGFFSAAKSFLENISQKYTASIPNQSAKISLPNNSCWSNNLIEQTNSNSDDAQKTSGEQKFWVEKSTDSKVLRDRLLRENFHFDNQDIAAYEDKIGQPFKITDDAKCDAATKIGKSCDWATAQDIKNWQTQNGKVSITLSAETIKSLQNFRRERVIDKSIANIADPALRELVKKDLLQITIGDGNRIDAANRLLNLPNVSAEDLVKVREAVKNVAVQPENRDNPMTNLIAANVKLYDTAIKLNQNAQNVGPIDLNESDVNLKREISDAEWQIVKAAKNASGVDNVTGKIANQNVNRQEAAWVNKQASIILRQTGNVREADYRERIGRYFEVDDKERKTMNVAIGGSIDRWKKTDTPSMRATTMEEQELREFEDENSQIHYKKKELGEDKFKREWKVPNVLGETSLLRVNTDVKGKEVFNNVPLARYNMGKGSIKFSGTVKVIEGYQYVNEKGKSVKQGRPYAYKNPVITNRTFESSELNSNGVNKAFQTASAVDAIKQVNTWTPILADLYITGKSAKRVTLQNQLEKAAFNATHYPVPPKPEQLVKEREKLVRMFGAGKEAEARINEMMQVLGEQSYAFWGK